MVDGRGDNSRAIIFSLSFSLTLRFEYELIKSETGARECARRAVQLKNHCFGSFRTVTKPFFIDFILDKSVRLVFVCVCVPVAALPARITNMRRNVL